MNPRFRTFVGLQVFLAVVAFATPLVIATDLHDLPPPIEVFVKKQPHYVAPGTTFGRIVTGLGVTARSGDLLDVEGKVLVPEAFPGRILLNGRLAPTDARLSDGDHVRVVNHSNRVEPLAQEEVRLPGRRPGDPQFYLGTAPGVQVVTTGEISGKLVSPVFRPTGRSHTPHAVALTFDDGPDPTYTRRILRILKKFHVHATFFTIGYLVDRYPGIVRREKRAGMTVADHTWDHPSSPSFRDLKPTRMRQEMLKAKLELQQLGVNPHLFRPPGGSFSADVVETARRMGMRVVLWSIDPQDWRAGATTTQIVVNVLSNARPGSIVLMHDGGGDQSATVRALPQIIKGLRKMHLKIKPVR